VDYFSDVDIMPQSVGIADAGLSGRAEVFTNSETI
jgi:hypothetical protein